MTEQFEIVALTDVDVAFIQPVNNEGDVLVRRALRHISDWIQVRYRKACLSLLHRQPHHVVKCIAFLCRQTVWFA